MARAAEDVLGDRIGEGFVVVKDGYTAPLRRIRLAEAGHPVPDARGLAATARLLELAARAREDDLVLVLVSGGGSALTPAPAPPVTLEEKQHVTRLLLAAGATIGELNAVRKHLSRFKGGSSRARRGPRPWSPSRSPTSSATPSTSSPRDRPRPTRRRSRPRARSSSAVGCGTARRPRCASASTRASAARSRRRRSPVTGSSTACGTWSSGTTR